MSDTLTLDDLRPRAPDRLSRGAVLAIVAHLGLLVALSLGVSWRSSEPAGVEAELWAAVPQVAAPRVEPPPPAPKPEPEPPKPLPKAEPPAPAPDRDAEIAREKREEKARLEKQRLEEERRERERQAAEAKREAERKKAEAARQKQLADERRAAAEAAQREKIRQENLARMSEQLSGSGAPSSTGTAAQSAGPSASYAGRIKARIKPNIVFVDEVQGNPLATVEVRVAPDGTITGRRLVQSSGVPAWDEAVLRAIDKTEVLPRDTDGRVPASMLLDFRPRDF